MVEGCTRGMTDNLVPKLRCFLLSQAPHCYPVLLGISEEGDYPLDVYTPLVTRETLRLLVTFVYEK